MTSGYATCYWASRVWVIWPHICWEVVSGDNELTVWSRKHCRVIWSGIFCLWSPNKWTSSLSYYLAMGHVFSATNFCTLNIMRVVELLLLIFILFITTPCIYIYTHTHIYIYIYICIYSCFRKTRFTRGRVRELKNAHNSRNRPKSDTCLHELLLITKT